MGCGNCYVHLVHPSILQSVRFRRVLFTAQAISMNRVTLIGIDIGKHSFPLHAQSLARRTLPNVSD